MTYQPSPFPYARPLRFRVEPSDQKPGAATFVQVRDANDFTVALLVPAQHPVEPERFLRLARHFEELENNADQIEAALDASEEMATFLGVFSQHYQAKDVPAEVREAAERLYEVLGRLTETGTERR